MGPAAINMLRALKLMNIVNDPLSRVSPLGNVPICGTLPPPELIDVVRLGDIVCRESLGGLLKHEAA